MAVNVFDVAPQYGYLGREDLLASIQPELSKRYKEKQDILSLGEESKSKLFITPGPKTTEAANQVNELIKTK